MRAEGLCANTSTCLLRRQLTNCKYQKLGRFEDQKLVKKTDLKKEKHLNEKFFLLHYVALQIRPSIVSVFFCLFVWGTKGKNKEKKNPNKSPGLRDIISDFPAMIASPLPPPHHFQENYLVYSLIFCTVKIQSISTGHLLKFSTSLCSILGLLLESLAFSIVQLPGLMMPLGQVLVWQKYRRQYMTSQQFQLKPVGSSDRRKHTDDK